MSRVSEMLVVGHSCGLNYVEEAYYHYMRHYDLFFLIDNFDTEYAKFIDELKAASLTRPVEEPFFEIPKEKITDACNRLNIPLRDLYPD